MRPSPIDPQDQTSEVDDPAYRAYFWNSSGSCEAWRSRRTSTKFWTESKPVAMVAAQPVGGGRDDHADPEIGCDFGKEAGHHEFGIAMVRNAVEVLDTSRSVTGSPTSSH